MVYRRCARLATKSSLSSTGARDHERVEVVLAHAAVDLLSADRQRDPHAGHDVAEAARSRAIGADRRSARTRGGLDGVADVQVVRPGLGEVLERVHRGVGRDVATLPSRRAGPRRSAGRSRPGSPSTRRRTARGSAPSARRRGPAATRSSARPRGGSGPSIVR